ncbi:hypothetical protein [Arthrobacter sp. HLT1-21]
MSDDITMGEIGRRLDVLTTTVSTLTDKLDNRPDHADLENARKYFGLQQESQDKAIKALEDSQTWIVRAVAVAGLSGLSALATALASALVIR